VLQALREHSTDAERAAVHFFSAASPSSAVPQPGGGPALALRPPAAAEAAVLAAAVQAAALELVARAAGEGVAVSELRVGPGEQPALAHLLDATLWLAGQAPAPVDLALPAACVEAVLEAAATGECEGVVAYLHSRLAQFQRPGVFQKSKHTLLRACTLLLARLAKSQHAPLRGRVLCVLAKLMPLTEPSGLNRGGAFNAGNATPVEEVGEGAVDAEGRPVDASLYASFWGLQAWFAAPASVLAGGKWGEVCRGLGAALDALAAARVTVGEAAAGGRGGEGGGEGGGGGQGVKYLSSARLLPLQLRDATFRRHFLVQALVLLGWCEAPTLKEWAGRGLKGRALEELAQLRGRVYAALEATPDCGPAFAAAVRSALRGEEAWVAWKARGCPREVVEVAPAAPPAGAAAAEAFPPRKRRRPSAEAVYGVGMGTDELDRLWNLTEDNTSGECAPASSARPAVVGILFPGCWLPPPLVVPRVPPVPGGFGWQMAGGCPGGRHGGGVLSVLTAAAAALT
jgi:THO complex subunit 1